ncbi:MAG TPA: YkgJ family cysteine cluster protein [Planctomycetota bacterium]|nr:YkgJ family cysteine cluster protein [Planctomycetota bacterium]
MSSPARAENSGALQTWFAEGVKFSCITGCVRCCGGAPGDVFITQEELKKIAAFMKMDEREFTDSFVRQYSSGKMSLTEKRNGDCVLLDEKKGCSVYDVRPKQCRDYPFWPEIMKSPFAWLREAQRCPGIGEGEVHTAPKIAELLKNQQCDE